MNINQWKIVGDQLLTKTPSALKDDFNVVLMSKAMYSWQDLCSEWLLFPNSKNRSLQVNLLNLILKCLINTNAYFFVDSFSNTVFMN